MLEGVNVLELLTIQQHVGRVHVWAFLVSHGATVHDRRAALPGLHR